MANSPRLLRGRVEVSVSAELLPPRAIESDTPAPRTILFSRLFLMRWAATSAVLLLALGISGLMPEGAQGFTESAWQALSFDLFSSDQARGSNHIAYTETFVEGREIVIPSIEINSPIVTPRAATFGVLNAALAEGPVHYPGSAKPGQAGTMFLFGHSSELPVVHNPAYKIFNRVKELKSGDAIKIREGNREYLYIIANVSVKRASEAKVDFKTSKKLLTISTCKLLGDSEEYRYVVEAEFLRSYPARTLASIK